MNKQRINWEEIEKLYKESPIKHGKEFCLQQGISYSAFTKKVKAKDIKNDSKNDTTLDEINAVLSKPFDKAIYQEEKHRELSFIRLRTFNIIKTVKDINVLKKAVDIYTAVIDRLDKHVELGNKIVNVIFDDSLRKRRDTPAAPP